MPKSVVALYQSEEVASQVIPELVKAGIRRDDISVVTADRQGNVSRQTGDSGQASAAAEGAGLGAMAGGLAGLVAGIAALAIPGIGPILAAGPIAGALGGAGFGALAGGLIGALVDTGVPRDEAEQYAEAIRNGGTLVVVHAPDQLVDQANQVLHGFGAGGEEPNLGEEPGLDQFASMVGDQPGQLPDDGSSVKS